MSAKSRILTLFLVAVVFIPFALWKLNQSTKKRNALYHFGKSNDYERAGDINGAIAEMEFAIKDDSDYLEAIIGLSDLYGAAKRYDEEVKILEKGLREHPTDTNYLAAMAQTYIERKHYDQAHDVLKRAESLVPNDKWFISKTALLFETEKNWSGAKLEWGKLQQINPADASATRGLSRVNRHLTK